MITSQTLCGGDDGTGGVVKATCGDDGGMSQTNDVVVTRALEVAAEMMCCDDGAMSQTNGMVLTTLVVAVTTYGDDGVISQTNGMVTKALVAEVVTYGDDDGVMS